MDHPVTDLVPLGQRFDAQGFDQPVDIGGHEIHAVLRHRQQYDALVLKGRGAYQFQDDLVARTAKGECNVVCSSDLIAGR